MKRILLLICLYFMISPITANEDPNQGFGNLLINENDSINESNVIEINASDWGSLFEQYNNSDIYMDAATIGPTGEQMRFLSIGKAGIPQNVAPIKPLAIGLTHYSRF